MTRNISVIIQYQKRADGSYFISSETLPGFRLEGPDLDALQRDLNPVVRDLLLHNFGFEIERIDWVPSPEDAKRHLQHPSADGIATYVAKLKAAA